MAKKATKKKAATKAPAKPPQATPRPYSSPVSYITALAAGAGAASAYSSFGGRDESEE